MKNLMCLTLLLAFAPSISLAKRVPPPTVKPVVHDGIKYVAPNRSGTNAVVQARNVKSNKVLWEKTIYVVNVNPNLESDVQDVFIKTLKVDNGKLHITAERDRRFTLDLKTRKVKELTVELETPTR